jgi:hypothetical protein
MARTIMAVGRVTPTMLVFQRRAGQRPRRIRLPRREPSVQELNAALIHDMQCPHGDACWSAHCPFLTIR